MPAWSLVSSWEFSFRIRAGLRGCLVAPSENSASGTCLVGKSRTNGRATSTSLLLRFRLRLGWVLDSGFISTQDHRAVGLSCQSPITMGGEGSYLHVGLGADGLWPLPVGSAQEIEPKKKN